jgi:hypothetical protein
MMSVIDEIAAERERQKSAEGWTEEHDDKWTEDELASAAVCYLQFSPDLCGPEPPPLWPWARQKAEAEGPTPRPDPRGRLDRGRDRAAGPRHPP